MIAFVLNSRPFNFLYKIQETVKLEKRKQVTAFWRRKDRPNAPTVLPRRSERHDGAARHLRPRASRQPAQTSARCESLRGGSCAPTPGGDVGTECPTCPLQTCWKREPSVRQRQRMPSTECRPIGSSSQGLSTNSARPWLGPGKRVSP